MKFIPRFSCWLLAGSVLLSASAAFGQIALTINGGTSVTTSYNAGDPSDGIPPSLRMTSTSTRPSSINYSGLTNGTVTVVFNAPAGYRFTVDPYGAFAQFSFQVAYTTFNSGGASGGLSGSGPVAFSFGGLQGTAPSLSPSYTLADLPHAYFAARASGTVTETFSFTSMEFTFSYTGTGANVSVPYFEGGNLSISDSNYAGGAPDGSQSLLTVSAIPEPSTYAAFAGVAVLGLALWRRRGPRK